MIKFKRTQGNQDAIELAYEGSRKIEEYVVDLADLFDVDPTDIKLVAKGKILNWKATA
jgi:aspartate 1-decarboxylase